MSRERQLYAMRVSPWSERARWVLDHHALAYREIEHVPMLGEGRLRRLTKRDKVGVPLLITPDEVLADSWEIARYAERAGSGSALLASEPAVAEWNRRTEPVMHAMRVRVVQGLLKDNAALDEVMPRFIPRAVRGIGRPMARLGTRYVLRKYGKDADPSLVVPYLDRVRAAISSGYVLGTFSYADIVVATLLQAIAPVDPRFWRIGSATRKLWTDPELAERYGDLLKWRDGIYERHRFSMKSSGSESAVNP